IKKFQEENLLPQSGVVEAVTFRSLFNATKAPSANASDVFVAAAGTHYDVAKDILMTKKLEAKLETVANKYFQKTSKRLFITSGYRPPERQAPAIFNNITKKGEKTVRNTYRNKVAIDQILDAYRPAKNDPARAIDAIKETIEKQIKRGVFISNHLLSNAIDIRVTADFKALGKAASEVGGRVITEGDHFHMELP